MAFVNECIPEPPLVDINGDLFRGVGAKLADRVRFLIFFRGEIRLDFSDGFFDFYVQSYDGRTDEEILCYIEAEGPMILLPKSLEVFARSRWNGAQEVFESAALLNTLDIIDFALPVWLGKKPLGPNVEPEGALCLRGYDDVFLQRNALSSATQPETSFVPSDEKQEVMPDQPSAQFYKEKKIDLEHFSLSSPGAQLLMEAIMMRGIDRGLKRKLYFAGGRWQASRDTQSMKDGEHLFRITEAASNETENRIALYALRLLQSDGAWAALSKRHRTVRNRSFAFRSLTKQIGAIIIVLKVSHENSPFSFFQDMLAGNDKSRSNMAQLCKCLRCDFADYWLRAYPGELASSEESLQLLACIAENLRVESSASECGHSHWQQVCRARSLQVIADHFEHVSATSFFRQNNRSELDPEVTPAPRPLGRKRQGERTRKTKRVRAKISKTKKKKKPTKPTNSNSKPMSTFNLFVKENAQPAVWGSEQFTGLGAKYKKMKATSEFAKLQRRAIALTNRRGMLERQICNICKPEFSNQPVTPLQNNVGCSSLGIEVPTAGETVTSQIILAKRYCNEQIQTFSSSPLIIQVNKIRSFIRKAGRVLREGRRSSELALRAWVQRQTNSYTDALFDASVFVAGVTVEPAWQKIKRVVWRMPVSQMAKEILIGAGEPQTAVVTDCTGESQRLSLHERLRQRWTQRHLMIKHSEQPKLGNVKASRFRTSLGRKLGFCVCPEDILLLFRASFICMLRYHFAKRQGNNWKSYFEANAVIVRLMWFAPDAPVDTDPLQVGGPIRSMICSDKPSRQGALRPMACRGGV